MSVLLINPPVFHYLGRHFDNLPVYGIAVLSALFRDAGYNVRVIDMEAMSMKPKGIDNLLLSNVDVIGFTCLSAQVQGTRECIDRLHEIGFSGYIMIGGIHPSVKPDEALSWDADMVMVGECEGNVVEVVGNREKGIIIGERMNINDIPSPDWYHYMPDITTYKGQYKILAPAAGVAMWTRGCPYSCVYCGNLIFNNQKTRFRAPSIIQREMEDLVCYGLKNIYVYDDEMIGIKQPAGWMREIADRIENLDMKWITQGRCSQKYITLELMQDMKRAGCELILWGVESFSPRVLGAIKKRINRDDIWSSLRLAKMAGIKNGVFLMVGNMKETLRDITITTKELRNLYEEGLLDYRQVFYAMQMPGTEMELRAKEGGWFVEPYQGGAYMKRQPKVDNPWMTREQMIEAYGRILNACPLPTP